MRNKMRKYICIIGIFILNLQLYNITYASVNDESGIGVEITSSEDNQSIEINLKNTSEHNYKNVSVNNVESYMISLETIKTKDGIKRTGDDILQARWSSLNTFFNWLLLS